MLQATMSKDDNKGGRPEATNVTNNNTDKSKSSGGNKQPKPSTK